ncbi:MAG TPA: hypothetical protein VFC10_12280 [Terriglobia bacterium]|jgi:hypothetical protein|nr:hypothetical protein [Terriglobia bacterium]
MNVRKTEYLLLAGLAAVALFVHGYHLGAEDQAIYLPGIRKILDPQLYPHDSELFLPQTNATLFGKLIACTVQFVPFVCAVLFVIAFLLLIFLALLGGLRLAERLAPGLRPRWVGSSIVASILTLPVAGTAILITDERMYPETKSQLFNRLVGFIIRYAHVSLPTVLFFYYILSLFLILMGCFKLAKRIFNETHAQWAGVCLVASLLTIPVAGTALYIVDEYLHPRAFAMFAVLFALLAVFPDETPEEPVERNRLCVRNFFWMVFWLAFAALFHIQMAFYGALLIAFLLFKMPRQPLPLASASVFPFHSLFEPASTGWRRASRTRTENYLALWHWYEWLGVVAPLALLEWFSRLARRQKLPRLEYLAHRLALFGLFGLAAGLTLTTLSALERLTPYQPMRTFQVIYLLFFLIAGGFIGKWLLRNSPWRWLALFVPLCFGMWYAQHRLYSSSPHIEWPGARDPNPWVQAFLWVRHNTPEDAYFALDPHFMELPGEDFHGFRAFAERSRMADLVKDPGVVSLFPLAGKAWIEQTAALTGWKNFTLRDFQRLKKQFGVSWVVVQQPGVPGLNCPYQNNAVRVCQIE